VRRTAASAKVVCCGHGMGYGPSGIGGIILVILLIMLLTGRL
jgi:Protein of unknown function (DUF3309)